jgi:hypothetical protein
MNELVIKKIGDTYFMLIKNEWMLMDSNLAIEILMEFDIVRIECV